MSSILDHHMLSDKPLDLPCVRPDGSPLKALPRAILDRRTTPHFLPDPVPAEYLNAILQLGAQAPSCYNLQPWKFIVVQDPINRRKLQRAAFNQSQIAEAPVVIIAIGLRQEARDHVHAVLEEGARRGAADEDTVFATTLEAMNYLDSIAMPVWLNRQVMIAVTIMMLAAEAYGFDTAPMEGFDAGMVKREFGIPDEGEVVALLAIGRMRPPDKAYPGRWSLEHIACNEHFTAPWAAESP